MARKRKKEGGKPPSSDDGFVLPKAPEKLASPFKGALGQIKEQLLAQQQLAQKKAANLSAKAPPVAPPPRTPPVVRTRGQRGQAEEDALSLSLAMQGVKPLGQERPGRVSSTTPRVATRTAEVAPFGMNAEEEARQRLQRLVAEDVSFKIERDLGYVRGARVGVPARVVQELARRVRVNRTLDLHGKTQREARDAVVSFVRGAYRDGADVLCIVHGKGNHSEGGQGVLCDVAVQALTETAAAQHVLAFATAPEALGGSGALLVELKR